MPPASSTASKVYRVVWGPQRFYLSLGWKTLIAFGLVVFLPMAGLLVLTEQTMRQSLEDELLNSLEANLRVVRNALNEPLDEVRIALAQTAQDDRTAEALLQQDSVALLSLLSAQAERFPYVNIWLAIDSDQIIRGRLRGPLGEHPDLMRIFNRIVTARNETLVSTDLVPHSLFISEDRNRYASLPPQVLTQVIAAQVPGAGVLLGLVILNDAKWLVQQIQNQVSMENTFVALLQGERVIATSDLTSNLWERNQHPPGPVERAIRAGQLFKGNAAFGSSDALVATEPLLDSEFQPIGALALAVNSNRIAHHMRSNSRNIYLFIAIGIGLSLIIAYLAYRDTLTPLQAIVNAQNDFASGDYKVRTEIQTKDEFERLGVGFNRMADAVEAHDRRLEQYNALSSLVNLAMNPEEMLQGTLDRVVDISRSQLGVIYLLDEGSNRLAPFVAHGLELDGLTIVKLGEELPGQAALETKVKRIGSLPNSSKLTYELGPGKVTLDDMVYFPLIYRGDLLGLLMLGALEHYPDNEFMLLEHLARQVAIILNDAVAQKKIRDLSVRDSLTGVVNRTYFTTRLEQMWNDAFRFGTQLTVLMVDIDHFRHFSDRYGYHVADNLLISVATTLKKSLRKSDLIARFGENRFAILLPHTDTEQSIASAEKIRKNIIGTTVPQLERERITISIGTASFPEISVQSPIELVRRANQALSDAKDGGRNRVVAA